jgi:hypothetical protein
LLLLTLIADREYVGENWFKSLVDNGLNFIIRLKKGDYEVAYNVSRGTRYDNAWSRCFQQKKISSKAIKLLSQPYNLVMCPNRDSKAEDQTVFLISNLSGKKHISETYLLRWKIERMFKQMKSEGYNLEDINLKSKGRRNLLILLVCMAYALTIRAALDKHREFKTIKRKDGSEHLKVSIFQIGITLMTKHTRTLKDFKRYIGQFFLSQNPLLN